MSTDVRRAAEVLRAGGLVGFPTETVYGLGADASSEAAVRRIFAVKRRPPEHPLIVHLADPSWLEEHAAAVPAEARRLAARFWPGPLTLVLLRSSRISPIVTGGQPTVGLRVPAKPLALALLRELGRGIAAPSANRFGSVSPTTAEHVRRDLGSDVDLVLDGGPCEVGIESTIVSLAGAEPAILRPGGIAREEIEALLGREVPLTRGGGVRVPGSLALHYAPRARLILAARDELERRAAELRAEGRRVAVLSDQEIEPRALYASLRRADEAGAEVILVATPPEAGLGLAVADRLRRAAGGGR